jgi:hypothetical protein
MDTKGEGKYFGGTSGTSAAGPEPFLGDDNSGVGGYVTV